MRVHAHPALFLYPCTNPSPPTPPHEPVITLAFMNVNNLYLRYKFGQRTPGRFGNDPPPPPGWGYLPSNFSGCYRAHDPLQVGLLADVLGYRGLPEVLALCEVESMQALRHFNHTALGGHYPHAVLVESRDPRQIDVGLLTTLPVRGIKSHVDDYDPRQRQYVFSRDCLEVELELPTGESTRFAVARLTTQGRGRIVHNTTCDQPLALRPLESTPRPDPGPGSWTPPPSRDRGAKDLALSAPWLSLCTVGLEGGQLGDHSGPGRTQRLRRGCGPLGDPRSLPRDSHPVLELGTSAHSAREP